MPITVLPERSVRGLVGAQVRPAREPHRQKSASVMMRSGLRAIEQRSRPIARGSSRWVPLTCTLLECNPSETVERLPCEIQHVFLAVEGAWQLLKDRLVRVLRAMRLRCPTGIAAADCAGLALASRFSFAPPPSGRLGIHREVAGRLAG